MTVGVLLTNLGTPDAPTPLAVRKYLAEFLSDRRVVRISPLLWKFILYGLILPLRASKSAKLYQKIWTEKGSPLRIILEEQVKKLDSRLRGDDVKVEGAMRYGTPSLYHALEKFSLYKIKKLIILPLYPQYSMTTTESTFDELRRICKKLNYQPELIFIKQYYNDKDYISAITESVRHFWQQHGQTQQLIFSFHGLPKQFIEDGDPYYHQCQETVNLIAKQLDLEVAQWQLSFQSRLGKTKWLQPYTDRLLKSLPQKGIKRVAVVCPGFSADCLETLEEIDQFNRENFLKAGGDVFHYIPALNASDSHIAMMEKWMKKYI